MNRIIHYTKGGSLNRAMHGLADDVNIPSYLPGEGDPDSNPSTGWLDALTNSIKVGNQVYKTQQDAETAKMNINMQRMLDSRPLPPPPKDSWTRLTTAQGSSFLTQNAKTIILVGGIAIAGLLLLKFISKNRK